MSNFWSAYIIIIVVLNLVGCAWLLWGNRKMEGDGSEEGETTGHVVDGLEEYNNPLPAWWTWMFVATLAFAVVYLVIYPGLGKYAGTSGWTTTKEWEQDVARAEAVYGPIYAGYFETPIPDLLGEPQAIEMGSRLFANTCATCHGSDARGGPGYPNLTDGDWLYGGSPETIVATITNGRYGNMPPLGAAVGSDQGVKELTQHVISLSGRDHDEAMAKAGAERFAILCAVCHGPDGKGNQLVGAPNLTDDTWLHGGRVSDIEYQIINGRMSQMPAHASILSEQKIHLVALYVYSLSNAP